MFSGRLESSARGHRFGHLSVRWRAGVCHRTDDPAACGCPAARGFRLLNGSAQRAADWRTQSNAQYVENPGPHPKDRISGTVSNRRHAHDLRSTDQQRQNRRYDHVQGGRRGSGARVCHGGVLAPRARG
jgi:hypothetical protein